MDIGAVEQAAAAVMPGCAAIVAMNFLGEPEDHAALVAVARRSGQHIVEDNAQWLPASDHEPAGDLSIVSFGRGKPVSLLGGGALLVREGSAYRDVALAAHAALPVMPRLSVARAQIGAMALQPLVYARLASLPGLNLGATVYHRLAAIRAMDTRRLGLLAANVTAYRASGTDVQARVEHALAPLTQAGWQVPFSASRRALRWPLLAPDRVHRDRLLARAAHLGASRMYGSALDGVAGVAADVRLIAPLNHAADFAQRLVTFPVHEGVSPAWIRRLAALAAGFASG